MSFLSQVRRCLAGSAGEFVTSGPSTVHPVGTQPSLLSFLSPPPWPPVTFMEGFGNQYGSIMWLVSFEFGELLFVKIYDA